MDPNKIFSRINNGIAVAHADMEREPDFAKKILLQGIINGLNAAGYIIEEEFKPVPNKPQPYNNEDEPVILRIPGVNYD